LAKAWAEQLVGLAAAGSLFFAGEFKNGPRVAVLPISGRPADDSRAQLDENVMRSDDRTFAPTRTRTRLMSQGKTFMWCSLAVLKGAKIYEIMARAVMAAQAFVGPVMQLADGSLEGSQRPFVFGACRAQGIDGAPQLTEPQQPPGWSAVQAEQLALKCLVDGLLQHLALTQSTCMKWRI